jgi:hypothetical protein
LDLEKSAIFVIESRLKELGAVTIIGEFIEAENNVPCHHLFEACGYKKINDLWLKFFTSDSQIIDSQLKEIFPQKSSVERNVIQLTADNEMMGAYKGTLYTPTFITKIADLFFIVDCWHHRIIYSDVLGKPIELWDILDDEIAGPHSIVSDGELYVAEDTGRHRLFVYKRSDSGFVRSQIVTDVGKRPHRVRYDPMRQLFFAIGSFDQVVTVLKNENGQLVKVHRQVMPEVSRQYVRSITLFENNLYIIGNKNILVSEYNGESIVVHQNIHLQEKYWGSNDLFFLNDGSGYFTSSPKQLYRFNSLESFSAGEADNLSELFKGTPYYIEMIDNQLFIPEITEYSQIVSYQNIRDLSQQKEVIFDFGPPKSQSTQRKKAFPV